MCTADVQNAFFYAPYAYYLPYVRALSLCPMCTPCHGACISCAVLCDPLVPNTLYSITMCAIRPVCTCTCAPVFTAQYATIRLVEGVTHTRRRWVRCFSCVGHGERRLSKYRGGGFLNHRRLLSDHCRPPAPLRRTAYLQSRRLHREAPSQGETHLSRRRARGCATSLCVPWPFLLLGRLVVGPIVVFESAWPVHYWPRARPIVSVPSWPRSNRDRPHHGRSDRHGQSSCHWVGNSSARGHHLLSTLPVVASSSARCQLVTVSCLNAD